MSETPPVLIAAPLREELAAAVARMKGKRTLQIAGVEVQAGQLGGAAVVAVVIGDGARRARSVLQRVLTAVPPAALVGIGVSGGLDPALPWGTILASLEVRGPDGASPAPDSAWQARARAVGLALAPLAVAERIVPTPEAKAALRSELGGDVACVDLESAVLAEEATRAGVPYLVLRAVVDEAGDTVARSILAAEDEDGHVSTARVVAGALLHPREIRSLKKLQKRVLTCADRLADALESMLSA